MIDPQVARILQAAHGPRGPDYMAMGAVVARTAYTQAMAFLDLPPEELAMVDDHLLPLPGDPLSGTTARTVRLRRYAPAPPDWTRLQPALLYLHGGGFTLGSPESHDGLCRRLAARSGCMVLSLDYRLAPEHRFPAAFDDARDALRWLWAGATSLGADPDRLAIGGDSAGGTLAAATALQSRDDSVARARGLALRWQMLIYPGLAAWQDTPSHRRLQRGYLLDAPLIQWFFAQTLRSDQDRSDWRFSPLLHPDPSGVPPVWMALAEYDPLHDEGRQYAERLRDAGVDVHCRTWPGMVHGFFQQGGRVRRARDAVDAAAAALATALGASPPEPATR